MLKMKFAAILFSVLIVFSSSTVLFAQPGITLEQIAQANEEAWTALKTMDMDFAVVDENRLAGADTNNSLSLQNRWTTDQERERLIRLYDFGGETMISDSLLDSHCLREHQVTRDENGVLFCGTISPAIHPEWQSRVNLSPFLMRYPCGEIDMDTTKTLRWIVTHWKSALGESFTTPQNETVWPILVQCPDELPWNSGTMRIEVNADKGYLVQKVIVSGLDFSDESGNSDDSGETVKKTTVDMSVSNFPLSGDGTHYFPNGFVCRKFLEPVQDGKTPQSVYKEVVLRSAVNGELPPDAFCFHFERGEIVTEYNALSEIVAVYLWGDGDQPEKTFASYEELERWQLKQDIVAFVTDSMTLPHIIGKDLGVSLGEIIHQETTKLAAERLATAERQRKELELRSLTPIPANSPDQQNIKTGDIAGTP